MSNYETTFIINNEITDNTKRKIINKIEECIITNGKIIKVDNLGTKKLSYKVKKQEVGFFCVIEFKAKPSLIWELEKLFRSTEEILKFIVLKEEVQ